MVNAGLKSWLMVLVVAAAVLTGVAALRSAEYDEQYTLFLTAGVARPVWPAVPFAAGEVRALQAGQGTLAGIARDLRAADVHPPLYFWSVALWRRLFGPSLFMSRMFSVLCGVAGLAAVGVIARHVGVPVGLAMLLTLGCYSFAFTGGIARGFALAQVLTLAGVAMHVRSSPSPPNLGPPRGPSPPREGETFPDRPHRRILAGVLLGAATSANYLAVFVALAVVMTVAVAPRHGGRRPALHDFAAGRPGKSWLPTGVGTANACVGTANACIGRVNACVGRAHACVGATVRLAGMLPFLVADLWFFLAQRNSRTGQFPPFHLLDALQRLARYAAAAMFGGLPLYVPPRAQPVVAAAIAMLALACAGLVAARWRHIAHTAANRHLLLAATAAPPAGLLALGMIFHNTPIELRYLAFAAPFAALLLAGALASLPPLPRGAAIALLLNVQAAALAGLALRPETMQPARATAEAASRLAQGGLVLLPRGNDGVGIVGAFAIEAPATLRLLVVDAAEPPSQIAARIGNARRVVQALLAQDDASRATLPVLRAVVANTCWQRIGEGFNVVAYARVCAADAPRDASTVSR